MQEPHNLDRGSEKHATMVEDLLSDPDVGQIAGFQSGECPLTIACPSHIDRRSEALVAYFPKVYQHMRESLAALYASQPELRPNFNNSAYPTATFNLGPQTVCEPHNDTTNYPGLACAITSLGWFDADAGGCLYVYDLFLKIRFPAGSTILLSSAGLRHGNAPIQENEKRFSFTQYCIGGILHWVWHGFCLAKSLPKAKRARLDAGQWEAQLARLSKYDELEQDLGLEGRC